MGSSHRVLNDGGRSRSSGPWLLIGIAAGTLVMCCVCGGLGGGWVYYKRLAPETVADVGKPKPDFSMTDHEFHADLFSKNRFDGGVDEALQAKYKDKLIELTGTVQKTGDKHRIFLGQGLKEDFGGAYLNCVLLAEFQQPALELVVGQKVKVQGRLSSARFAHATLEDCSFEALEQKVAPRVSLDEIAAEFDKDSMAARQKFATMDMIVTGTIERIDQDRDRLDLWRMKTVGTKTRIVVMAGMAWRGQAPAGQDVEFRAGFHFRKGHA